MAGVSDPIEIPPEKFSPRTGEKLSPSSVIKMSILGKSAELSAPILNDDNSNYATSLNVFPQFAFEKINIPQYGVKLNIEGEVDPVARFTGVPYSAEFIKDYHLISLFRLADKLTTPKYSGKVKEQFESPEPNK